ncbi:MAG: hypothetical protein MZU91_00915 [Desulfosudis oleivorans]|nr:hypothetical protein [Desulfosudis oleivorans]
MPAAGHRRPAAERQERRPGRGVRRLRQPVDLRSARHGHAALQDDHHAGHPVHGDLAAAAGAGGRQEPFRLGAAQGEAGGQAQTSQPLKPGQPASSRRSPGQVGRARFAKDRFSRNTHLSIYRPRWWNW